MNTNTLSHTDPAQRVGAAAAKSCGFCGQPVLPMAERCSLCAFPVSQASRALPEPSVMPFSGSSNADGHSPTFLALVSRLRSRFFGPDR